jgi:hypothetical protein
MVTGVFGPIFAGEECQHGRREEGPEDTNEDQHRLDTHPQIHLLSDHFLLSSSLHLDLT